MAYFILAEDEEVVPWQVGVPSSVGMYTELTGSVGIIQKELLARTEQHLTRGEGVFKFSN